MNLDGATTPALWDDPDNWPTRISIVGFEYGRFWKESAQPQWDAKKRVAWLARQEPLDAAPYEQLAGVLRARGQPQQAEAVQVAYLRRQRLGLNRRGRFAEIAWDRLTLYGFQPWRVVALMGLLILSLTGLLLLQAPETRCEPPAHREPSTKSTDPGRQPAGRQHRAAQAMCAGSDRRSTPSMSWSLSST